MRNRNQQPLTETAKISEVKNRLSGLVNAVSRGETRVIIEKAGSPVAALVSADDFRRLQKFDREWDQHTKAMERFSAAFADIPTEEAESEIARIIADIRQKDDAEVERQPA